jgi:polysaccharide export outer membrane protein
MTFVRRIAALVLGVVLVVALGSAQDQAHAQGYVVETGDTLLIEVLQDDTLNRNVLVTPDGTFNFPFAGEIRASGRTAAQISERIAQQLAPNFAAPPNVFVSVVRLGPQDPELDDEADSSLVRVFLLGEVNSPGAKEFEPGVTLLQALSTSGGFTNFAATKRLQLRRTDPFTGAQGVTVINYRAIAEGAALSQDIVLTDGDVILVPQRRLFE